MGFGDLAAEDEADAGAAAFGSEEGDEQVGGIGEAGAFVANGDFEGCGEVAVVKEDAAVGGLGGFDTVLDEVDEGLFELIDVALEREWGTLLKEDALAGFARWQARSEGQAREVWS